MSIADIKNNLDNLDKRSKEDLINHIHELLIHEKRLDNKIVSMKTEVKYLTRHLTKVRDLIDKTLNTSNLKDDKVWTNKNGRE